MYHPYSRFELIPVQTRIVNGRRVSFEQITDDHRRWGQQQM